MIPVGTYVAQIVFLLVASVSLIGEPDSFNVASSGRQFRRLNHQRHGFILDLLAYISVQIGRRETRWRRALVAYFVFLLEDICVVLLDLFDRRVDVLRRILSGVA